MCSICQFLWCKSSHNGLCQATKMTAHSSQISWRFSHQLSGARDSQLQNIMDLNLPNSREALCAILLLSEKRQKVCAPAPRQLSNFGNLLRKRIPPEIRHTQWLSSKPEWELPLSRQESGTQTCSLRELGRGQGKCWRNVTPKKNWVRLRNCLVLGPPETPGGRLD